MVLKKANPTLALVFLSVMGFTAIAGAAPAPAWQAPSKPYVKRIVEGVGYDYETLMSTHRVFPKTKLVLFSPFGQDGLVAWHAIADAYKAVQPKVEVQIVFVPRNEYLEKTYTTVVAGSGPDIIMADAAFAPFLIQNNLLAPLDSYIKTSKYQRVLNDCFPAILSRFTVGGKLYGLPTDTAPNGLFFHNKKLLAEAGLTMPKDDWTWDDFVVYGKKLVQSPKREGFDPFNDLVFVYSNGGKLVDDVQKPTKVTITTPQVQKAVQLAHDLIFKHKVMIKPWSKGTPTDLFQAEKLAMMIGGIFSAPKPPWNKFDYDVTLPPRMNPSQSPKVSTGGTSLVIMKGSKKQEAAWDFIRFACGPIGQCFTGTLYAQPVLRSMFHTELFARNDKKPLNKRILAELTDNVVYDPYTKASTKMINVWNEQLGRAYSGKISVDQALATAQGQMQKLLDDANKGRR